MSWEALVRAERILVALDFDGTVAPIVPRPELARALPATAKALRRLSEVPGTALALVSGRDADDLAGKLEGLPPLWLAGGHGRVVLAPGERPDAAASDPRLEEFRTLALPVGVRRELKSSSVAFHWRGRAAGEPAGWVADLGRRVGAAGLELLPGRQVAEVIVPGFGKERALARLLEATESAIALYAGDDRTDQEAIREAQTGGGLGVFVASGERSWIPPTGVLVADDPARVAELLEELARARLAERS